VPEPPLDGGRIVMPSRGRTGRSATPSASVALLITRSPLLLIVLVVGLFSVVQRWRNPSPVTTRSHRASAE
jgi:hypothetical protein